VVTLTVTDAGGKTASTSFTVTVTAPLPAVRVKGDLNGDGKSDILFEDNGGFVAAWLMNGTTLQSAAFLTPSNVGDAAWRISASGDFNRDGKEDVLYQHTDGTLAVWFMDGNLGMTAASLLNPANPGDRNWRVAGTADLNKDGNTDLLFQHTDGTLAAWFMDGVNLTSASLLNPSHPGDAGWRIVGAGDLNADGKDDLIFQHNDGTLATWFMNGTSLSSATLLNPSHPGDVNWRVVGVGQYGRLFAATLSGAAERPTPVTTSGTGSATLRLVGNQLTYTVTWSGLGSTATAGHIHAPAGVEGTAGVIVPFSGVTGTSGTISGSATLTDTQAAQIRGGEAYVNIHTGPNPGGEIRGQIVADTARAGAVDLLFQHTNRDLAVWLMDGASLNSAQLLDPSNSGGTWSALAPK
jgi:hypothetical protein